MRFYPRVKGPTRIKEVDEIEYSNRDLKTVDCPGGANHDAWGTKCWDIKKLHLGRRREINIQKIIKGLMKNVDRVSADKKKQIDLGHKTDK